MRDRKPGRIQEVFTLPEWPVPGLAAGDSVPVEELTQEAKTDCNSYEQTIKDQLNVGVIEAVHDLSVARGPIPTCPIKRFLRRERTPPN
uniref:Uncharacterized protein n=1 Tax=Ditylenchus dipsaci TaxID=166011 RepID=A0A915CSJ2_9BILA